MTIQSLLKALLACNEESAQRALVSVHLDLFDEPGAAWFKDQAILYRLEDTQKALQIADAILAAAQLRQSMRHRGYGLWANAVINATSVGDYTRALTAYEEAIAIFAADEDVISIAKMQISRIWALAHINRVTEALAVGEETNQALAQATEWYLLAKLRTNIAAIYSRNGDDVKAIAMYEDIRAAYAALGTLDQEAESNWAIAIHNYAVSLFYLGKFTEAIENVQVATAIHERLENPLEVARTQQLLGMIHFVMGRYNKGLRLLNEVRTIFATDGSLRHTARVDLYICDCLLHLGRFTAVLDKIPALRTLFRQLNSPHEEGVALLYGASAYVGNGQVAQALAALDEARLLFVTAQNLIWLANCDLAKAHLLHQQERYAEALKLTEECVTVFGQQQLATYAAEAKLLTARIYVATGQHPAALALLEEENLRAVTHNVPALAVPMQQMLGQLAREQGCYDEAINAYTRAITALEYLRGQMMVEHRITFQRNKQAIYEEMVSLCLQLNQVQEAFGYVERVKSRALLDLVDNRIDLRIQVRAEADRPLIEQLLQLRSERDRLYRQSYEWEPGNERGWLSTPQDEEKQKAILQIEKEIGELWHNLLIRNADYAQDVPLHTTAILKQQPDLDTETILLEYFTIQERLLLFLVTQQGITAIELPTPIGTIKNLIERLQRHMQSVSRFPVSQHGALEKQAQFLLHALYAALVAPVAERISAYPRLMIVPHDVLHYLPFHALYDNQAYLIERYEISYLPNASLWHRLQQMRNRGQGVLAVGCSADGQLPHTLAEAKQVAQSFQGDLLLEEAATHQQTAQLAANKRLIHFATHAMFDADQPLFSGLLLADGWLTAFDVFNLQLQADLVTLSACQTGRNTLGGGDELLGLLRAFLYAGANALVVSHWAVDDRATAAFMINFYTELQQPITKSAALRNAQIAFCHPPAASIGEAATRYTHPYFWASFFLIGNPDCFLP